ncbi:hypothetical protein ACFLTL_01930 [Chloroflexota bacterium]
MSNKKERQKKFAIPQKSDERRVELVRGTYHLGELLKAPEGVKPRLFIDGSTLILNSETNMRLPPNKYLDKNRDITLYKYLRRDYASELLKSGILQIGTLSYYKNAETLGAIIGDVKEGSKSSRLTFYTSLSATGTPPDLASSFFDTNTKGTIEGHGFLQAHQKSRDYFVYSTTSHFDKNAMSAFGYDSCIKIHEPNIFFDIISHLLISEAIFEGIFDCTYISRELPADIYNQYHPALIKDPKYIYQREVRAIWRPRSAPIQPKIIVCPEICRYCSMQ